MVEAEQLQREFQNGQLAWAKAVESFTNQTSQSKEGWLLWNPILNF